MAISGAGIRERPTLVRKVNMNAVPIPERRIRVVVADDHPLVRKLVATTFLTYSHIDVVAEAKDGLEAVEQAKKAKPDVVILNVSMPRMNGFQAAQEIKKHVPDSAIVILSTHADKHFIDEARKLGVRVYLSKNQVGESLVKAVEAAVQGEDFVVMD
jgi:two-component system, NarL family, nitrate/nitrite response regulator NarL